MNFKEFMDLENSRKKINKIENYTLSSKSQSKYEEIEGEDFRPLKRARLQKLSKEIDLLQNPIASPSSKTSANKQNSEEGSKNSTIKEPSRNLRPRIKLASSAFDNGSRVSKNSASLKRNQTTEQKVNKRPSRQNTFESIDNLMHKNNSNDWTSSKKKITVKIPPNGLHTNSKKKRHVNNSEKGSNARPHSLRPYQINQGHKNLPQSNRDPEHEPGISSIAKGKQKAITVINDKSMGSFSQVGPSSLTGMKNFRNSQSKNLSIFDDLINARIEASKMKETLGDLMMKNLKMDATKSLYSSSENPQSNSSSSETEQGLLANPKETLHSEQSSSSSEKSSTNDDHGGDLKKNSQVVRPFPIINVSNFNQTHKKAPLSKLNFWSSKSYQSETSSSSIGIGKSEDETNLDEKSRFNFFDFSNDTCNAIS
ncbi:hypothetical protein BY996DRAFT_4217192 [Phakopsora pachyrhizi]|nr:hypothetical protein BY996DRAFT_4217192 [Phakopsora pachyrhizi]